MKCATSSRIAATGCAFRLRRCSVMCRTPGRRCRAVDAALVDENAAPHRHRRQYRVARKAVSARRRRGTAKGSTSRSTPSTPSGSSFACSIRRAGARSSGSTCASAPISSGIAICPPRVPGCCTATACTAPTRPSEGHRFNAHKLLLDPYARNDRRSVALERCAVRLPRRLRAAKTCRSTPATTRPECPSARSSTPAFTWGDDRPPRTPWQDTVIYELHVKGYTKLHPDVPPQLARHLCRPCDRARCSSTCAASASPPSSCCRSMRSIDDKRLVEHGLRNYWGYNTIGFFAPDMRYSATGTLGEFKTMVKALHSAGIEVILDVVYNHTAEGNHLGPTLSFRGIDNAVYYRLQNDARYYVDFTGTGNTLNTLHPIVLRLIFDSLRYWVTEMHVDGFRFDLASTLAREAACRRSVRRLPRHRAPGPRAVAGQADRGTVGPGRRRLPGRRHFRPAGREWNGRYRDAVRAVLERRRRARGRARVAAVGIERHLCARRPRPDGERQLHHCARRLHAARSRELQRQAQRGERRGQPRRRIAQPAAGTAAWKARPTTRCIRALRARQMRNFIATLFFSQGVPMLLGGDELGRTQNGNNNAYCQDNETSWLRLESRRRCARAARLHDACDRACATRHPLLRRRTFFRGRAVRDRRNRTSSGSTRTVAR